MENKKTTIHDIAAILGITASTVSRALAGHPRISQATRDKVQQLAKELNYQPNKMAANLRIGRGNSIGVIVPRINRSFFSNAIAGMESVTNNAGYTLMICQTNEEAEAEIKSVQSLINNQVDGIIMSLSAGTVNTRHLKKAFEDGIRLVQFDRVSEELKVNKVVNDNVQGAFLITKYLIEQGHRNVIHFSGPLHINVYRDRYAGYLKAMKESGLDTTDVHLYENVLTRVQGAECLRRILNAGIQPDAIFCASDFSALGAQTALRENNIGDKPKIEIVGFGNEPFTELMEPGMTSVEQFSMKMGQEAARLLIENIENPNKEQSPKEILIETKLISR